MIRRGLKLLFTILVVLGVFRAVVNYQKDTQGQGIPRVLGAIVDGIADITYRWLPSLFELIGQLISALVSAGR